jgi:mannose-6-phosphate isomerase-like protein (cupin superfamily)
MTDLSELLAAPLAGLTIGGAGPGGFAVGEWQQPGGGETSPERPVVPLHRHLEDPEAWYVLEGRLGFRVGDATLEAGPGDAVYVPAGVAHTFWNASSGRTRYLIVMPARIQQLVAGLHELPSRDRATLEEHFRRYGAELL